MDVAAAEPLGSLCRLNLLCDMGAVPKGETAASCYLQLGLGRFHASELAPGPVEHPPPGPVDNPPPGPVDKPPPGPVERPPPRPVERPPPGPVESPPPGPVERPPPGPVDKPPPGPVDKPPPGPVEQAPPGPVEPIQSPKLAVATRVRLAIKIALTTTSIFLSPCGPSSTPKLGRVRHTAPVYGLFIRRNRVPI